ncbi:MAG TPA: ThiF family adenylyltransferase [Trebonia sp.]|nr:ThiF family adenylyltransferase [Trebonia sp.]
MSEQPGSPAEGSEAATARDAIRERLGPVLSASLRSKLVVIAGLGSGGSQTAEALVRSGVERLVLIDPEQVEPANISRSVYTLGDVGVPKTQALARRLREINPLVDCRLLAAPVQDLAAADLGEIVSAADLVIGATDDLTAQRRLNHVAWHCQVPAVFAGVYARGHGGEVIFTVPGISRCYRCATNARQENPATTRQLDYGTGRLAAEPALGADILHVVTASVKIALGLLEIVEEGTGAPLRDFVLGALERGYNYLILSTVPGYAAFGDLFSQVPGQYAYQSAWLVTLGSDDCPVCGTSPADPATVVHGGVPDLSKVRLVPREDAPVTAPE